MASDRSISDTESSTGSSGSGGDSSTLNIPLPPPTNYKCSDCSRSFPSSLALFEHQRETSQMSSNMARTAFNLLRRNPQPVMPPSSPPTPPSVLPPPPRANLRPTSRLAPIAPAPINNAGGGGGGYQRYHPYMRAFGAGGGGVNHGYGSSSSSSSENRTMDLLSQLDPTKNFLSQMERQYPEPSGNGANEGEADTAAAALDASKGQETLNLNLNLML